MSNDDKITLGILSGSLATAVAIAFLILFGSGCCSGCKVSDPIVHPTDEQIENGTKGGESKDPPYVPWWAVSL